MKTMYVLVQCIAVSFRRNSLHKFNDLHIEQEKMHFSRIKNYREKKKPFAIRCNGINAIFGQLHVPLMCAIHQCWLNRKSAS